MTSTSETNGVPDLVKTGRDGRVRYSAAQKQRVLELFAQSGMSGKVFAEKHGLKYPTFALWRRQQRELDANPSAEAPGGFLLAEISRPSESAGNLSLVLSNGAEVKATGEAGVELMASLIHKLRLSC
jgi:transposase-like protein